MQPWRTLEDAGRRQQQQQHNNNSNYKQRKESQVILAVFMNEADIESGTFSSALFESQFQ